MKEIKINEPALYEPEITLTMTRADWKLFRNALQEYVPEKKDKQRYNDLYGWITTDWDD